MRGGHTGATLKAEDLQLLMGETGSRADCGVPRPGNGQQCRPRSDGQGLGTRRMPRAQLEGCTGDLVQ